MAQVCRVQYINDLDPLSISNLPEPTRPISFTFQEEIPLCNQLPTLCKILKPPQKVCIRLNFNTQIYFDLITIYRQAI